MAKHSSSCIFIKRFIEQLINNLSCSGFHTQPNVFAEGKEVSSACKSRSRIEAVSKSFSRLDKTTLASLLALHYINLKSRFLNKLIASSAIFCASSKPVFFKLFSSRPIFHRQIFSRPLKKDLHLESISDSAIFPQKSRCSLKKKKRFSLRFHL